MLGVIFFYCGFIESLIEKKNYINLIDLITRFNKKYTLIFSCILGFVFLTFFIYSKSIQKHKEIAFFNENIKHFLFILCNILVYHINNSSISIYTFIFIV